MITVRNLHQYSEQEVFDYVVNHLLTQNKQARLADDSDCAYRTEDGLKCAVGCLIPDDLYKPEFERRSYRALIVSEQFDPTHQELISRLQMLHDDNQPGTWKENLSCLASSLGLEFTQK